MIESWPDGTRTRNLYVSNVCMLAPLGTACTAECFGGVSVIKFQSDRRRIAVRASCGSKYFRTPHSSSKTGWKDSNLHCGKMIPTSNQFVCSNRWARAAIRRRPISIHKTPEFCRGRDAAIARVTKASVAVLTRTSGGIRTPGTAVARRANLVCKLLALGAIPASRPRHGNTIHPKTASGRIVRLPLAWRSIT